MAEQKKLWELPPEPTGHLPGHRPRGTKAGPATKSVDTGQDNVPADPIEELAGALTDPTIVFPAGGWENDIPQHLKDRLPIDRLAHQMRCHKGEAQWDEACDLEALLYMYPRTMASPLSEQWTRIYLYLGTKVMGDKIPQDIKQERLSDYDMAQLRDLKRWIHKRKVKARRERRKGEKVEVVPAKVEYPRLF